MLQLLYLLFDTPLSIYGDRSDLFPSINLQVTCKFLRKAPTTMKIIPYFQCVPTLILLVVVWHNLLKSPNKFILSHLLHDGSSHHNKNNWNLRCPQALNQKCILYEYFSDATKVLLNGFSLINKPSIIHKGTHSDDPKANLIITFAIIIMKELSPPWWYRQWNYRAVDGILFFLPVDGKCPWSGGFLAYKWRSFLD